MKPQSGLVKTGQPNTNDRMLTPTRLHPVSILPRLDMLPFILRQFGNVPIRFATP